MMIRRRLVFITLMAMGLLSGNAMAADAKSQVLAMTKKLAEAKQFSVSIHIDYDSVQKSGQKILFSEVRKVVLSRPNRLRVDARQSDGDAGGLIFDGKMLTLFNTTENVYSQNSRPGNVDEAVRYAVGTLGVRVPLARMLLTTLPAEVEKLSTEVEFVEQNTLGTAPTAHVAGRAKDVDFQFWIGPDNLPTRVVLTYKNVAGEPQFRADFSDWNLAPSVPETDFNFSPPAGAEKIPNLLPRSSTVESGVLDTTSGGA